MSSATAFKETGVGSRLHATKQYRNSEIGLIPIDWKLRSVGCFAAIRTGPFGTLLKASEYASGDGVPLISVGEIRDGFLKIAAHTPRVSPIVTKRLPEYLLRNGDIVFGRKGGVERSAIVLAHQEGWFLGSDGISIRSGPDCHSPYLAFQFQSSRVKDWLLQHAIGTTMPSLNQDVLGKVLVPFPPTLAEQQAIAEALSDADALIEGLESLIAKKRAIKQGAMQDLLTGKRRLPGFEGEWVDKSLLDLATGRKELFDDGDWIEAEYLSREGIRFIQTGNIGVGSFVDRQDRKYISEDAFRKLGCKEVRPGDLLICRLADPAGRACVMPELGEQKLVTSVDVTIFRPPAELADREFLSQLLSTRKWLQAVSDQSGGTTHKRIARGALGRLRVCVPTIEEQAAIAAVLSDMDAEIEALEGKLAKARAVKQGMMQELLTGRIRLV